MHAAIKDLLKHLERKKINRKKKKKKEKKTNKTYKCVYACNCFYSLKTNR